MKILKGLPSTTFFIKSNLDKDDFSKRKLFKAHKGFSHESGAGFTIIELVVIVAVVAVLSAVIILDLPKTKFQFALSRVAYKFTQDVRRTEDMALSQNQYKNSEGIAQRISGYGFYADMTSLGNKKYIIYADANILDQQSGSWLHGNEQYDALDYIVETIDFSSTEPGIVIKEIDNVSDNKVSINFDSTGLNTRIIQLNQNQNNVNVVFALESDLTKTKTVSINIAGLVENK
jgi:type II secretory pathway pseudopilin PulG